LSVVDAAAVSPTTAVSVASIASIGQPATIFLYPPEMKGI
jgi:hypothetical protein